MFPACLAWWGSWLWLLGTKGVHTNNGDFVLRALTQLRPFEQGGFGGKSEGISSSQNTANAQPTGSPSSCFPRNMPLFSPAKKELQHELSTTRWALLNLSFEHMPLSLDTQMENQFVQEQCFWTLLSTGLLTKQQAKNRLFCRICESYLDGISFESWYSKISLEHHVLH